MKPLISKNLKYRLAIYFVLISFFSVQAQEWKLIDSVNFHSTIDQVSIDRQANLYISTSEGAIEKYDRNGQLQRHFSSNKRSKPSLIEAWQGLRVFSFYKEFQEYLLLDRLLNNSERYILDNQKIAGFISLATTAADNNIWLLDGQSLSLKKLDINNQELILETSFSLNLLSSSFDFSFMREYQNLLFIADRNNGVHVFDNIGNYLETLETGEISSFSFNRSNLIYLKKSKIVALDFYSKQKREISLPDSSPFSFVLMENTRVFLFTPNRLLIYELN
jgi:hypothetical protein